MHNKKSTKHQKIPFTDEQIRSKAYQISQKYPERSPDENWDAAIKAIKKERFFRPLISIWRWTGIPEKKGWDILQLAVTASIPVLLFFGTQYFSTKNNKQQQKVATDKANQDTLVKYLDEITKLLDHNLLKVNKISDEKFIIAQAKTVIALQSLDKSRQQLVIQFLDAAKLNTLVGGKGILYQARMSKANLNESDLSGANLYHADLSGANLYHADLSVANLSDADLIFANLSGANLSGANLSGANLYHADLSVANLYHADLSVANLYHADLSDADLRLANLNGANLNGANLSRADLTWMTNFSPKQIKSAKNWRTAKYNGKRLDDPEVSKQLGLDAKP
jgi:uncharacterized protein YjbI with pentapeptide repeats